MKEPDLEQFEIELRGLRPSPAPEEWLDRVAAELPAQLARKSIGPEVHQDSRRPQGDVPAPRSEWWRKWLGWQIPATAMALGLVLFLVVRPGGKQAPGRLATSAAPADPAVIKADRVEVDQELLATFDAVTQLPGGEPIRFRCREWKDQVTLHDSARGVVIERREPRLEIIPVRFETY